MLFKSKLAYIRQRLRRRPGHLPGLADVSTVTKGEPFKACPNFYYFLDLPGGRPGWLPVFHRPQRNDDIGLGYAVTEQWPYEAYRELDLGEDLARWSGSPSDGDWVQVIGQVPGQDTHNEIGQHSNLWDVILVPIGKATASGLERCQRKMVRDEEYLIGFAPDIWLGNTGPHELYYHSGGGEE